MAQSYPGIEPTDLVSASRSKIIDRDNAVKSSFSGTAFPSTDLAIGMLCFRTDLSKIYALESTGPSIWRELQFAASLGSAAFKSTGTSGNTIPLLDAANTWSLLQTFSSGIAIGANEIAGTAGSFKADADLRLNAASGKAINFLLNNVSKMTIATDGGLVVGAATGGSKGGGSINAQSLYQNGNLLNDAAYRQVGKANTRLVAYEDFGTAAFLNVGGSGALNIPQNQDLSVYAKLATNGDPGYFVAGDGTLQDITAFQATTFSPGNVVQAYHQDSLSVTGTTLRYRGKIYINKSGGFRISFEFRGTSGTGYVYAYKNDEGSAIQSATVTANTNRTITWDFTDLVETDFITLYLKNSSSGGITDIYNISVGTTERAAVPVIAF